jgi:hypothetical protein
MKMNKKRNSLSSFPVLLSGLCSQKEVSILLDNQIISPISGYRVSVERDKEKNNTKSIKLKVLNPENREYKIERLAEDFLYLSESFQKEFPFRYVRPINS